MKKSLLKKYCFTFSISKTSCLYLLFALLYFIIFYVFLSQKQNSFHYKQNPRMYFDSSILRGGPLAQERERTNCCFSAPSDLPIMPLYWFISMATGSLHISCNNVVWYMVGLEKPHLQCCLQRVHSVIGLINSNMT